MAMPEETINLAVGYANRGLDGDYGDHEMRMRQLAYAQVMATVAIAEAIDRAHGWVENGGLIRVDDGR